MMTAGRAAMAPSRLWPAAPLAWAEAAVGFGKRKACTFLGTEAFKLAVWLCTSIERKILK
jgi:hypothetical protein